MLGISTSWKSTEFDNGRKIIEEILETGITKLELEYRITAGMFDQMKSALKKYDLTVLSVHNYFPHPEILPFESASGDSLLLSSTDEEERKFAVKYACRSIDNANRLEATAVVFHLGKVDIDFHKEEWFAFYDNNEINKSPGLEFKQDLLNSRRNLQSKYLDNVFSSLDIIVEYATKQNINIGVENRYFPHEIPSFEEIGLILKKFEGSSIGYWHDCGHAQKNENFGITKHEEYLKAYADKLIGIHLHDCNGYNDHIAPGKGKIDFNMIKKYLPEHTIKIIEVHKHETLSEMKSGLKYLTEWGIS